MWSPWKRLAAWCLFGATALPLQAQDAAAPPALSAALREVLSQAPTLAGAAAQWQAARAELQAAARPLYNPELTLEREQADVDTTAVGIDLGIDWSGKRRAHRSVAAAQLAAQLAAYRDTRQQLALQWLDAWLELRNAEQQLRIGAQRVAVLQQFADLAARRFTVGDLSSVERDLALLASQQARIEQARLIGAQARARATLAGISPVVPDAALPGELPAVDADAAIDTTQAPQLLQARALAEAAQLQVRSAQLQRRPDPTVSVRTGQVDVGLPQKQSLFSLGVSVPLPLLNSHGAELRGARATARAAEQQLADRTLQLDAQAAQARSSFQALRDAWLSLPGTMSNATTDGGATTERTALLQRLWQSGELSSADYLVQLQQTMDTELERSALWADAWRAWIDWRAACGQLDQWLDLGALPDTAARDE
ncbi:MAG: TolC family protein [Steroidobacteraceae bacterium]